MPEISFGLTLLFADTAFLDFGDDYPLPIYSLFTPANDFSGTKRSFVF